MRTRVSQYELVIDQESHIRKSSNTTGRALGQVGTSTFGGRHPQVLRGTAPEEPSPKFFHHLTRRSLSPAAYGLYFFLGPEINDWETAQLGRSVAYRICSIGGCYTGYIVYYTIVLHSVLDANFDI